MSFRRFVALHLFLLRTSASATVLSTATAILTLAEKSDKHDVKGKHDKHVVHHYKPSESELEERDTRRRAVTAGVINNPAVTVGMFMTVCALVGMMRKSYLGDRMGTQQYMQYRIMAQFFTLMALIAGVGYYSIQARREADAARLSDGAALATAEAAAQTATATAAATAEANVRAATSGGAQ